MRRGPQVQEALGGTVTDITSAIASVVQDPCLLEVARTVNKLSDVVSPPGPAGAPTKITKGIGLCSAVRPLRAVTYIAERPWIVPVGITVLFGGLIGIGYMLGRGR